jgi:hypothetical protein
MVQGPSAHVFAATLFGTSGEVATSESAFCQACSIASLVHIIILCYLG